MSVKATVVAPGVVQQYTPGEREIIYLGRADALIAAGLVHLHQLPGQPGNPASSATFSPTGERMVQGHCRHTAHLAGKKRISRYRLVGGEVLRITEVLSPERIAALTEAAEAEERQKQEKQQRLAASWPFPVSSRGYAGALA